MKMNLKSLHDDIRRNNRTYDVFNYRLNNIVFNVIFSAYIAPPEIPFYRLCFNKRGSDLYLGLDVKPGYYIDTYLGDKLKILYEMLEIESGRLKPLKPSEFFAEFNKYIPITMSRISIPRLTLSKACDCEDEDLIYKEALIYWDNFPDVNGKVRHASEKNKQKTSILYPELYKDIKDKNISVRYRKTPPEDWINICFIYYIYFQILEVFITERIIKWRIKKQISEKN